jgi:hypothetical protein
MLNYLRHMARGVGDSKQELDDQRFARCVHVVSFIKLS